MEQKFLSGFIFTLVSVMLCLQTKNAESAVSRCSAGEYIAGNICIPCSNPPKKQDISYSISCEGLCQKGRQGLRCDVSCSTGCLNDFCNRWTGHCIHGCKGTYYGNTCDIRCLNCQYCDNSVGGIGCVCTKGYFGNVCQKQCPVNCKNKTCTSSGSCRWGCIQGWVGSRCNIKCTHCRYDFSTDVNCMRGWYGFSCNQSCASKCRGDLCHQNGSCVQGCRDGQWGEVCDFPCPSTCHIDKCSPTTGWCVHGCKAGWYGDSCEIQCPGHCSGECRSDGTCLSCTPGFTGPHCNKSCPPRCLTYHQDTPEYRLEGTCDQLTGLCSDGCVEGWFGNICNQSCPENCRTKTQFHCNDICKNITGAVCSQDSGRCTSGCQDGWYSEHCDRRCSSGCRYQRCETDTGQCLGECTETMYGVFCNYTCSRHCIKRHCGSAGDADSVVCIEGCVRGWRGTYCQDRDETPSRMTMTLLSVLLCIAILCLMLMALRKRVSRCLPCHKGRERYISPINNRFTYSTQPGASFTSGVTWDQSADIHITYLTDDNTSSSQDSTSGYEAVILNDTDDAAPAPLPPLVDEDQGNNSTCQEELYTEIPNSSN